MRWLLVLALLVASGCAPGAPAGSGDQAAPAGTAGTAGTGQTSRPAAASTATATVVPPTPTPAPTPIPEPREYAIAGGGRYFAETGFAVRDEPNGPRFWTEFQKQGGAGTLGLPTSRPFDAPEGGRRAQAFQHGWLAGAAGAPAASRGEGPPPPAPAEAQVREDRPEMDFIGRVDVMPKQVRQGGTVLLRVWSPKAQAVTVQVENRTIQLAKDGDAFIGLYGTHRQGALGQRPVRFTITDPAGQRTVRNDPGDTVTVVSGEYPVEEIVVDPAMLALLDRAKIAEQDAILNRVYSQWTPEKRWTGKFVAPVGEVAVTSDYGIRRSVNGGPPTWAHEGTDFDVQAGDPVKAAANGKVVFAGPLHALGNSVVIDHGLGVMTGYHHFFSIAVQEGQDVSQSDVVGLAGSTGFVTGPHLHFELRVNNVHVEPLEWLGWSPFERPDLAGL